MLKLITLQCTESFKCVISTKNLAIKAGFGYDNSVDDAGHVVAAVLAHVANQRRYNRSCYGWNFHLEYFEFSLQSNFKVKKMESFYLEVHMKQRQEG